MQEKCLTLFIFSLRFRLVIVIIKCRSSFGGNNETRKDKPTGGAYARPKTPSGSYGEKPLLMRTY